MILLMLHPTPNICPQVWERMDAIWSLLITSVHTDWFKHNRWNHTIYISWQHRCHPALRIHDNGCHRSSSITMPQRHILRAMRGEITIQTLSRMSQLSDMYSTQELLKVNHCITTAAAGRVTCGNDPNGSCLFAAGLPADIVGSQNFLTFSTRHTPHLVDWWGELTTTTCGNDRSGKIKTTTIVHWTTSQPVGYPTTTDRSQSSRSSSAIHNVSI